MAGGVKGHIGPEDLQEIRSSPSPVPSSLRQQDSFSTLPCQMACCGLAIACIFFGRHDACPLQRLACQHGHLLHIPKLHLLILVLVPVPVPVLVLVLIMILARKA